MKYSSLTTSFEYPAKLRADTFALEGAWKLDGQFITPREKDAGIRLNYNGEEVRIVLAGSGTVTLISDGKTRVIKVDGTPQSYELIKTSDSKSGELEVRVGSGVQAYSFTFG